MYYVAHRLFALHDRAFGARIAAELARHVGDEQVFLPFCDTDEENLIAERKGQRLFELDCQRLEQLTGMIAVLHGPSLDDGVCMEIGYAAQRNVPIILVTTDFQTYGPTPAGPQLAFPDPLIELLATALVRVHQLAAPQRCTLGNRFEQFERRNLESLGRAAHQAVAALLANRTLPLTSRPTRARASGHVVIEPSPYQPVDCWQQLAAELATRGQQVYLTRRLATDPARTREGILAAARDDWAALEQATLLIVDLNGPETPPGAALMIGASAAAGRPILALQHDRAYTFAHGREPNFRNLMIQYALTARATNLHQLTQLLPHEPHDPHARG